jgi:catechol 2,3-dioxygenase-like lactoylglutathione lyase family enzyme
MKLEVVAVPVSDVDRAEDLYQSLGWRLDADFVTGPDFRVILMNPARLGLRDHFRHGDHLGRARFGAGPHHPPAVPRDIRAGGIRLPDWPGRGTAPRAAVAHGKHEEETAISSPATLPIGRVVGPPTLPSYRRRLH